MSRSKRRVQASKRRTPDLTYVRPLATISETCSTGLKPLPWSVAKAVTRAGGLIVECPTCDWYHVVEGVAP